MSKWILSIVFCLCAFGCSDDGPGTPLIDARSSIDAGECLFESDPYNFDTFTTQIVPFLVTSCATCHGAPKGDANFNVWTTDPNGMCAASINTFNSLLPFIDLDNPKTSRVSVALDNPRHSQLGVPMSDVENLKDYINDASMTQMGGGARVSE